MKDVRDIGETSERLMASLLEVAAGMQHRLETDLRAIGLSRSLYETLGQLADARRCLTMCELASGEGCAPSNITQKMDRLEREGLVRRVPDPADRRVVLAEVTPLGRKKAEAAREIVERHAREFEQGIPECDRHTFIRVLTTLQ